MTEEVTQGYILDCDLIQKLRNICIYMNKFFHNNSIFQIQKKMTERGGEIFVLDGMEFLERKERRGPDGS